MGDATGSGCSELGGAETSACVDSVRTIDNNRPAGAKGKVDIVAREKQIDTDSEIYYVIYPTENGTSTTSDKTNKTPILIIF